MFLVLTLIIFMQFKTISYTDINALETMQESELRAELTAIKTKYTETMEQLKETIHRLQLPFPVYADHELKISDAFENLIVPAYYLFDEQQRLRFLKYGFVSTKSLQQKIERII